MHIGKAAKVATIHNDAIFQTHSWVVTVIFSGKLSMFEYHKSWLLLFVEVIRIWPEFTCLKGLEIILKPLRQGKSKRKLWGLESLDRGPGLIPRAKTSVLNPNSIHAITYQIYAYILRHTTIHTRYILRQDWFSTQISPPGEVLEWILVCTGMYCTNIHNADQYMQIPTDACEHTILMHTNTNQY